ncbi:hypothetical protein [Campylobacter vicugnae]|uniref:hypothetical protein n=1 Tax=Campylobacter vicugnae TaxID=1660076 RepID=UPI000A340C2F|nr:hypothetical protein [Campylobacter sp. RM8966]
MNIIELLTINQSELGTKIKEIITNDYRDFYSIIFIDNGGIIVTPKKCEKYPLICSHLDTINDQRKAKETPKISDINIQGDYISLTNNSPCSCLGGDDRCGVYIALELIKARLPYAFGFFYDEEIGGIGSKYMLQYLTDNITAFIGLDRRGADQAAIYGYDNSELMALFERRGYFKVKGSFTDASNLAGMYSKGVACINLSVGYYNEHTPKETINTTAMNRTLTILKDMVDELTAKPFLVENSILYNELYQSELYYYGDDNIYNYDDEYSDDSEALEQWYIKGYNNAMEQGYELSKDDLLYNDNLKEAEAWYISYRVGFKDALDDMENLKYPKKALA